MEIAINQSNYFNCTTGWFWPCFRPATEPDYVSFSGSEYWYSEQGFVRCSDHWGYCIAFCHWYLKEVNSEDKSVCEFETLTLAQPVCGFTSWDSLQYDPRGEVWYSLFNE